MMQPYCEKNSLCITQKSHKLYFMKHLLMALLMVMAISCRNKDYIVIEGWEEIDIASCMYLDSESYVIDDTTSYHALLSNGIIDTLACVDYTLPPIDFSRKTLLGHHTSILGCNIFYERELLANPKDKTYTYSIQLKSEKSCSEPAIINHYNWIVVPKIPEAYNVDFKVAYN